jgi:hypothetical protein
MLAPGALSPPHPTYNHINYKKLQITPTGGRCHARQFPATNGLKIRQYTTDSARWWTFVAGTVEYIYNGSVSGIASCHAVKFDVNRAKCDK